jgi:hypothetical protein
MRQKQQDASWRASAIFIVVHTAFLLVNSISALIVTIQTPHTPYIFFVMSQFSLLAANARQVSDETY